MDTGSLPEVKRSGRGVDHPPHLVPRLKKEYSYTSPPPLGFYGFSMVNFTFPFTVKGTKYIKRDYYVPSDVSEVYEWQQFCTLCIWCTEK